MTHGINFYVIFNLAGSKRNHIPAFQIINIMLVFKKCVELLNMII